MPTPIHPISHFSWLAAVENNKNCVEVIDHSSKDGVTDQSSWERSDRDLSGGYIVIRLSLPPVNESTRGHLKRASQFHPTKDPGCLPSTIPPL